MDQVPAFEDIFRLRTKLFACRKKTGGISAVCPWILQITYEMATAPSSIYRRIPYLFFDLGRALGRKMTVSQNKREYFIAQFTGNVEEIRCRTGLLGSTKFSQTNKPPDSLVSIATLQLSCFVSGSSNQPSDVAIVQLDDLDTRTIRFDELNNFEFVGLTNTFCKKIKHTYEDDPFFLSCPIEQERPHSMTMIANFHVDILKNVGEKVEDVSKPAPVGVVYMQSST